MSQVWLIGHFRCDESHAAYSDRDKGNSGYITANLRAKATGHHAAEECCATKKTNHLPGRVKIH